IPDAVMALINSAAGGVQILIRHDAYGIASLRELTQQISSDQQYWEDQSVGITSWGPDYATDSVQVSLTNYSADDVALITARYAGLPVTVPVASEPLPSRYDRTHDFPPWYGGNWIKDSTR